MYKNVGRSIKDVVKVVVGIEMVIFIILGFVLMITLSDGLGLILGAIVAGAGCFVAWLSGLILYAYGDIADNVKMLANAVNGLCLSSEENMGKNENAETVRMNIDESTTTKFQRNMIKEYRAQLENGVLTPEQYKSMVEKILKEDK